MTSHQSLLPTPRELQNLRNPVIFANLIKPKKISQTSENRAAGICMRHLPPWGDRFGNDPWLGPKTLLGYAGQLRANDREFLRTEAAVDGEIGAVGCDDLGVRINFRENDKRRIRRIHSFIL